jgi:hypothetical protein
MYSSTYRNDNFNKRIIFNQKKTLTLDISQISERYSAEVESYNKLSENSIIFAFQTKLLLQNHELFNEKLI